MRLFFLLLLLGSAISAQEADVVDPGETDTTANESAAASEVDENGVKPTLGMSILGNEEAPKALVIVPWKSSQIGEGLGVGNAMDDRAAPVDREVFMREVRYYQLRSGAHE